MKKSTTIKSPALCAFFTKRGSNYVNGWSKAVVRKFENRWSKKPYSFLVDHIEAILNFYGYSGHGSDLDSTVYLIDVENVVEMMTTPPLPAGLFGKSRNSKKTKGSKTSYNKRSSLIKIRGYSIGIGGITFSNKDKEFLGDWFREFAALEDSLSNLVKRAMELKCNHERVTIEGNNSAKRLIDRMDGNQSKFSEFAAALEKDLKSNGVNTFQTSKLNLKKIKSRLGYSKSHE